MSTTRTPDGVGPSGSAPSGVPARFDELFDLAAPLLLSGRHGRDEPPVDGGRWGVTVALRLPDDAAAALGRLTEDLTRPAGPGHFLTGRPDAVHVTLRALEPYRDAAAPDDAHLARPLAAVAKVATRAYPVVLRFVGLTLAPGSVMACLVPVDDGLRRLTDALAAALGPDGWFEADLRRDIVYASLLHLAADVTDPAALVSAVAARRRLDPVDVRCDRLDVVRYRYADTDGARRMAPEPWAVHHLLR